MLFSFLLASWIFVLQIKTQSVQPCYLVTSEWWGAWLGWETTGSCSGLLCRLFCEAPSELLRSLKQIFVLIFFYNLFFLWNARSVCISSLIVSFCLLDDNTFFSRSPFCQFCPPGKLGQVHVCDSWWASVWRLLLEWTFCFEVMKDFVIVLSCVWRTFCILVTPVIESLRASYSCGYIH